LLIILGGSTPFLFQAYKMYCAKSIKGFSTFTSLILVLANVIRVYWWIIERFQIVIMLAAVAQIICQLITIYSWVLVKQMNETPHRKRMELSRIDTETGTKLSDGILEESSDALEEEFEFNHEYPDSPGKTPTQII
jgi:hypothetical protein